MERSAILSRLSTQSSSERPQTTTLRHKARSIISASPADDINTLPTTLLDLLSQIIKPLFIKTHHPQLTSTGRKNLVSGPPPSIGGRFLNDPLEDDEDEKPWKTSFTVALLEYILTSYVLLPFDPPDNLLRRTTIEAHFHLLVPPILNMIDDPGPKPWKSSGCHLLFLLCEVLVSSQSEMLKRSGLTDVFVDALKTNFLLLPTLTPEEESLVVLGELYPAFLGVIDARFIKLSSIQAGTWLGDKPGSTVTWTMGEDFVRHQEMLTLVYRHGIMASLSHLSASSASFSNTSSAPLTTFLLQQIPKVFTRMGLHSVKHLQGLLPMVRVGLMDPFILAAPDMTCAILDVLDCVIEVGEPRVKEKWWTEILRGLVGCWLNCLDDGQRDVSKAIGKIMTRLKNSANKLGEIVGKEEWDGVVKRLIEEEVDVKGLFET
ncbi:hypothetical protein H2200_003124 [Cladophialophora chaetospira]|uniref:Uncharacterized protein n=1 Tax=Cladophialophora chaetospira TaxID=386627 RepID=A0AA38XGR4_9EURO|nr:hypothetical protein H2200_003124 [Cladophialophora chaetospira]